MSDPGPKDDFCCKTRVGNDCYWINLRTIRTPVASTGKLQNAKPFPAESRDHG